MRGLSLLVWRQQRASAQERLSGGRQLLCCWQKVPGAMGQAPHSYQELMI
jgi:hypothetical protein